MASLPLTLQPDPDVPDAVMVCIDATVIDETMQVIVDTGGGSCAFTATRQTEALDAVGSDDGWGATGTVTGHDIVIVPCVSLGPVVARDVRAGRIPTDDSLHPSYVGMNVLGHHRCHFKFTSAVLEIDEPTPPDVSPAPFAVLPAGQPVIDVRIGGEEATALWDTGASLTVVDEAFAAANPQLFEVAGPADVIDSAGVPFSTATATMSDCTIGDVHFAPTVCAIHDMSPVNDTLDTRMDLAVGTPLMVQADWLFDFPAGIWAVARSN